MLSFRYGLLFIICILVSCVFSSKFTQHKLAVNKCKSFCIRDSNICHKTCQDNCVACNHQAHMAARDWYQHFVKEQTVQGGMITRNINSYKDPLQCRKITCNCDVDYLICTQKCSGLIHKELQNQNLCA